MSVLFKQNDFSGGLSAGLDPSKIAGNSYPLLVNGRIREGVVSPTAKHVALSAPSGSYQGLYVFGSYLLLFVDGLAYSADVTADPIIFYPVENWAPMDSEVSRIYAEQAPATADRFNKEGSPDDMKRVFNNSLAIFPQAVYCFDGSMSQAVKPNNTATRLGSYDTWTKDNPLYVPAGVLPAFAGAKLYLVAPTLDRVLHSVSGRPSDFVINLNVSGDKGGDADTVSQTVSYNPITAMRALSSGEVLVGTLFGTYALVPDYSSLIFGEPYLQPVPLFPAGPVNELSIVDTLTDTAFISQSGIHKFNAVMQRQRASNNEPIGAQIRRLISNPRTKKAIIQKDTCAVLYDDYVLFAVNTIHGYGVLVYDANTEVFHSLDLSFGRVKQFAVTKFSGVERLFFITHDNKIYEGFASEDNNPVRMLLGEWTPDAAPKTTLSYMADAVFTNVQESGQVKFSFYADRVLRNETVLEVQKSSSDVHLPIPLPFVTGNQTAGVGATFGNHYRAWKCATMIEWNFQGELAAMSVDGKVEEGDNVKLEEPIAGNVENLCFLADSGYPDELNTGGDFGAEELVIVPVTTGMRYIYFANGNGELINGGQHIAQGVFTAARNTVAIQGTGAKTFSLRTAENYLTVLDAIYTEAPKAILHGGDFAYEYGTRLDVEMAKYPLAPGIPFHPAPGNHDIATESGRYFFNLLQVPRFYTETFEFVDVFIFNGNVSEPKGISSTSIQAALVKNWLANSAKPFKLLVCHQPPYTNDINHYPGDATLRYLAELPGLSAILSGHGHVMERFDVNGFPLFVCGAGGATLRTFEPNTSSAFRDNSHYGYIHIRADALSCRLSFKDVNGAVLDSFVINA